VRRETPSASAASGKDRPPKYRSVTSWALSGSRAVRRIDRFVQGQDMLGGLRALCQSASSTRFPAAAALVGVPGAGVINQDAAHGLGGCGRKSASDRRTAGRPQGAGTPRGTRAVCLKVSCPGVSRASFWAASRRQLVVDQRQELAGGVRVAVLDRGQYLGPLRSSAVLTSGFARRGNQGHYPSRAPHFKASRQGAFREPERPLEASKGKLE